METVWDIVNAIVVYLIIVIFIIGCFKITSREGKVTVLYYCGRCNEYSDMEIIDTYWRDNPAGKRKIKVRHIRCPLCKKIYNYS